MTDPSPIRPEALLAEADWLHRLARAMLRDDDLAHDVAQDTLVAALGQPRVPVTNLRAWLQAIAQRLAARRRRTEARRMQHERQVVVSEGDEREAATAERLRLHRRLCEAVLELPEPYRTAVSLRFFDDLPPRAIARRTGASAAVVRQRVHRGLTMLRERFDGEAGDRGAWTRAFATAGFGAGALPLPVLLPLFVMKKLVVAAALLVVVGAWWWGAGAGWWQTAAPPIDAASAVAADPTASAPRGAAAAAPASVRTAVADVFTVRAVDAQDRLVEGASVHRWRADGEVEVVRTNERGLAEFAPRPEAGGVLVQGRGLQTVVQALPSLRGEVVVRLGGGRVVAGRVFEDGAPAPAGLVLKLSVPPQRDDLPEAPDAILDLLTSSTAELTAVTDGNGDFSFAGLADRWAGELQVPSTHWLLRSGGQLVAEDRRLLVLAPDSRLRVETTRLPTLRGRVEWSDGSGPVQAWVSISRVVFADGTTNQLFAWADEQGRFAVGLAPGAHAQRERWLDPRRRSEPLRIEIGASRGTSTTLVLEAGGGPLDLRTEVVLRLDRPVPQRFRVVDPADHPIAGARALQGDGTLSEPTSEDGLGTSQSPFGLWVGAPGRQVAAMRYEQRGRGSGQELQDVVLGPGNEVRVRVRSAPGGAAAPHGVELIGKRAPYDRESTNLRRWLGESAFEFAGASELFRFDRRGEARIVSLTPEVPCRLVVRDHFGGELAAQEIVTPALGEQRVIDITLTAAKYSVRGRVVDASGAPVAVAAVQLRTSGAASGRTERSAADGSFRFVPMHAIGDLVLTAHRQGFAAIERVVTLGELEHELTITLSPARRTTVRIVDEDGAPVPEPMLVVEAGTSRRVDRQQIGPGEYACLDLPPGEVTFACWIAGKRHELRHDTAKASAELRVPRTARARFERPAGWQPGGSGRRLIAVARRLDATAEPLSLELDDDARGVPQLLLPGRYRIELSDMWWNYEQKRTDLEPRGPAAEVELRAGEVVRVSFR